MIGAGRTPPSAGVDHRAAFIPPLLLHHLTLKWYFSTAAKTSLLGDPGACGAAKPSSPICKNVWGHPFELMGQKVCLSLLQLVGPVVPGLFSV